MKMTSESRLYASVTKATLLHFEETPGHDFMLIQACNHGHGGPLKQLEMDLEV